jgi:hypothetical protein
MVRGTTATAICCHHDQIDTLSMPGILSCTAVSRILGSAMPQEDSPRSTAERGYLEAASKRISALATA